MTNFFVCFGAKPRKYSLTKVTKKMKLQLGSAFLGVDTFALDVSKS